MSKRKGVSVTYTVPPGADEAQVHREAMHAHFTAAFSERLCPRCGSRLEDGGLPGLAMYCDECPCYWNWDGETVGWSVEPLMQAVPDEMGMFERQVVVKRSERC